MRIGALNTVLDLILPGPHQPPALSTGGSFSDILLAGVRGDISAQESAQLRSLLDRLQADPYGKIIFEALQAYHDHFRQAPAIVVRRHAWQERPSLNDCCAAGDGFLGICASALASEWHVDLAALAAATDLELVREFAAVYCKTTGYRTTATGGTDIFLYRPDYRDRPDSAYEKKLDKWAESASGVMQRRVRHRVAENIKTDLRQMRCYGGLIHFCFNHLLEALRSGNPIAKPELYATPSMLVLREWGNDWWLAYARSDRSEPRHPPRLDIGLNEKSRGRGVHETSLPPVPADLQAYCIDGCRKPDLSNLPSGLKVFRARSAGLEDVPQVPDSVEILDIAENDIRQPRRGLPSHIKTLIISDNPLRSLPPLRAGIMRLEADRTCLTPAAPVPRTVVQPSLRGNRIPAISDGNPEPPPADVPTFGRTALAPQAPLPAVMMAWLDSVPGPALSWWSEFGDPPHANDFRKFLIRLLGLRCCADPAFRADIQKLLVDLSDASREDVRELIFAACRDATSRCDDRVAYTLNQLKTLMLNDDIRRGLYDGRIADAIAVARQMFRLAELEKIAADKAATQSESDQIEVYLAYQVKLRDALDLSVVVPDMLYYGHSRLKGEDMQSALAAVRRREKEGFEEFLALDYDPWQTLLQRLEGERYRALQETRRQELERRLEQALAHRLNAAGLAADDPDGRRTLGRSIFREISLEILQPLTREYLERFGARPRRNAGPVTS